MLVALGVVGLGASVVPRVMGMQSYAIISGSMEPAYPTGSLVYAEPAEGAALQAGDVAAFWRDQDVIVHRVRENVSAEGELVTKGDANDAEDGSLVHYKNVIGTPVFTIPKLGYVANYIQHPPGLYVAISAGAVLLLLTFLPDLLSGGSDKGQGKHIRQDSQKA